VINLLAEAYYKAKARGKSPMVFGPKKKINNKKSTGK